MAELLFRLAAADAGYQSQISQAEQAVGRLDKKVVQLQNTFISQKGVLRDNQGNFVSYKNAVNDAAVTLEKLKPSTFTTSAQFEEMAEKAQEVAVAMQFLKGRFKENSIEVHQLNEVQQDAIDQYNAYTAAAQKQDDALETQTVLQAKLQQQGIRTTKALEEQRLLLQAQKDTAIKLGDPAAIADVELKLRQLKETQESLRPGIAELNRLGIQTTEQMRAQIATLEALSREYKDDAQVVGALSAALNKAKVAQDRFSNASKVSQRATTQGAFAMQNFSFAVQDASQFSLGFNAGLRGIANNLDGLIFAFIRTGEEIRATNGSWGALLKQLVKSPIALLVLVNVITSAIQIIGRLRDKTKGATKDFEDLVSVLVDVKSAIDSFAISGSEDLGKIRDIFKESRDELKKLRKDLRQPAALAGLSEIQRFDEALKKLKETGLENRQELNREISRLNEEFKGFRTLAADAERAEEALGRLNEKLTDQQKIESIANATLDEADKQYIELTRSLAAANLQAGIWTANRQQENDIIKLNIKLVEQRSRNLDKALQQEEGLVAARLRSATLLESIEKAKGARPEQVAIGLREQLLELEAALNEARRESGRLTGVEISKEEILSDTLAKRLIRLRSAHGQRLTITRKQNELTEEAIELEKQRIILGDDALRQEITALATTEERLGLLVRIRALADEREAQSEGDFSQQALRLVEARTSEEERKRDLITEQLLLLDDEHQALIAANDAAEDRLDFLKELNSLTGITRVDVSSELSREIELLEERLRIEKLNTQEASARADELAELDLGIQLETLTQQADAEEAILALIRDQTSAEGKAFREQNKRLDSSKRQMELEKLRNRTIDDTIDDAMHELALLRAKNDELIREIQLRGAISGAGDEAAVSALRQLEIQIKINEILLAASKKQQGFKKERPTDQLTAEELFEIPEFKEAFDKAKLSVDDVRDALDDLRKDAIETDRIFGFDHAREELEKLGRAGESNFGNLVKWMFTTVDGLQALQNMNSIVLGGFGDLAEEMFEKSDKASMKWFRRMKRIRIAEAIINTAVGVTMAYKQFGPVAGSIMAAGVVAAGAAQVAAIRRTEPGSGDVASAQRISAAPDQFKDLGSENARLAGASGFGDTIGGRQLPISTSAQLEPVEVEIAQPRFEPIQVSLGQDILDVITKVKIEQPSFDPLEVKLPDFAPLDVRIIQPEPNRPEIPTLPPPTPIPSFPIQSVRASVSAPQEVRLILDAETITAGRQLVQVLKAEANMLLEAGVTTESDPLGLLK